MPPSLSIKPSRNSMYGWTKKRSVSPSAPTQSKSKPSTSTVASTSTQSSTSHATSSNASNFQVASAMPAVPLQQGSSTASSSKIVRRDEPTYFEEAYKEDIMGYMTEMDVSQTFNHRLSPSSIILLRPSLSTSVIFALLHIPHCPHE